MSAVHTLRNVQRIPATLEKTWGFFSDPNNLLNITPPFLNLKVTNEIFGTETYPGQIITYTVKPLFGIPIHWMTEITHVEPKKLFVDEQRKGPYKLWHHQHHFKTITGGRNDRYCSLSFAAGLFGKRSQCIDNKNQTK